MLVKTWYIIFMRKKETIILIISSIVLGLIVGLSSLFLGLLLNFVEHLFLHFEETARYPMGIDVAPSTRLWAVFAGGIISAIIWWILRTKVKPPVTIKAGLGGQNMPALQTAIHVITQIFYVGTGGSVGRELAPREAGAMIAQKWNDLLLKYHLAVLSKDDVKLLMAAAAGAGFAGVYNAPITGMFFCIKILLKKISFRTVGVSLSMSIIAMLVSSSVRGTEPYYLVGHTSFDTTFLPFVIVIAALCGIAGGLFRKSFTWAEKHQTKSNHILWQLPLMALVTGMTLTQLPQIMGNGRPLAQMAISTTSNHFILLLLLSGLIKGLVTVLTIRSGAAGGTLTPSIAIGAVIGTIAGMIVAPITTIPVWQFSVLGGCSLLAASQQAPLMALFMIIEVSHLNYSALIPLGLGVIISTGVAKIVLKITIKSNPL